ncbi:MAG: proprotein convertase P-domain-containing protein [Planctomycetota bacterium]
MIRRSMALVAISVLWIFGSTTAIAQPANDSCEQAIAIANGVHGFSTVNATFVGAPPCASMGSDIWYLYTALADGVVQVSTCGQVDYDSALAVYPNAPCLPAAGTLLNCNDDTSGCGVASYITFDVIGGQTYLLQLGGWEGAQGAGTFTISTATPPGSDSCATPTAITEGNHNYSTAGATTDGPAPCGNMGSDIWYSYTASVTGEAQITTCGAANYDSVIAVYPSGVGCPPAVGLAITCNDDTGGVCGLPATVNFAVTQGTSYLVQVGGYNGSQGIGTLQVSSATALIEGLTCSSVAGSGLVALDWTNTGAYDSARVTFDGVIAAVLPGPFTAGSLGSYTSSPQALQQAITVCVEPIAGAVSGIPLCCDVAVLATPAVEACSTPGAVISAGLGETVSTQIVTDAVTIADLQLEIEVTHAAVGELTVLLESPEGVTITLHNTLGGDADDMGVTWWQSGRVNGAPFDCACFMRPSGPGSLLDLAGSSAAGTWALTIVDNVAGNDGVLESWCLRAFDVAPAVLPGPDVLLGELTELLQLGREGDEVGCAPDSPLCNSGVEPLDWMGIPSPLHPFIAYNMYRLEDGRFEQIGMSWVKHGFGAAQDNACGLGCTPYPDSTRLGLGCSDTYNAPTNGAQGIMGPRSEINPWTGAFTYAGSHIETTGGSGHDEVSHRLRVLDADLDPALHPDAEYYCELIIFAHDDSQHGNNIAHEPVNVSGAPGGFWSFDISADATALGPAINAWVDAQQTVIEPATGNDGRAILACRVTDNGDGTWHYDYAIYNFDMERMVRSLDVPVAAATTLTNIEFRAFQIEADLYSNDPWTATRDGDSLMWSTPAFGAPGGNPIIWGTMYSFRFDADAAPVASSATIGLYKPGVGATLSGSTSAPAAPTGGPQEYVRGDANADGAFNIADPVSTLNYLFASASVPCLAAVDANADGSLNIADAVYSLSALFTMGAPPPAPHPGCGPTGAGVTACASFSPCD